MVRLEGDMSLKNPVTPPGIDHGIVRLEALHLNHYATPGPVTTSTHGIYNYVPQTNPVYTAHSVAAVLYLQSALPVMLFRPCSMFCTFTAALPAVCVQCTVWLFFAVP